MSAPTSAAHIISRTAIRLFIASVIFQIASLADEYTICRIAMILCWVWACHHLYGPLGAGIRWLVNEIRGHLARRQADSQVTAAASEEHAEVTPLKPSQWGLDD